MIDKLSSILTRGHETPFGAFCRVFKNPNDVCDFYNGCRDYHCWNHFMKRLDQEYDFLKMLNQNADKPFDELTIRSKSGDLWVNCKLKPEYTPRKEFPTITPTKHYCNYDEFRKLYPNAKGETLGDIIGFVLCYEDDSPKGSELLKSFNRQLNDEDDYIVLRCKVGTLSHKLLIKKSDLI